MWPDFSVQVLTSFILLNITPYIQAGVQCHHSPHLTPLPINGNSQDGIRSVVLSRCHVRMPENERKHGGVRPNTHSLHRKAARPIHPWIIRFDCDHTALGPNLGVDRNKARFQEGRKDSLACLSGHLLSANGGYRGGAANRDSRRHSMVKDIVNPPR